MAHYVPFWYKIVTKYCPTIVLMSHIVTFFYNAVYYDDIVPTLRPHLYTSPHHLIVTFFYYVENYDDIIPAIAPRLET